MDLFFRDKMNRLIFWFLYSTLCQESTAQALTSHGLFQRMSVPSYIAQIVTNKVIGDVGSLIHCGSHCLINANDCNVFFHDKFVQDCKLANLTLW